MKAYIKQEKRQSDCSGGELSPQPHINNIGLCVHYMILNEMCACYNIKVLKYIFIYFINRLASLRETKHVGNTALYN